MTLAGIWFWVVAIAATVIVLGLIVLAHELGHFVTARVSGIRVLEFGIGFPPRAKVIHDDGETIYTLNWLLPVGGFVKLEGEDADSEDPRAFGNASLLKQLFVLVAGVTMNVIVAFLLFFFVAMLANPTARAQISNVEAGSPAATVGIQAGDTLTSINGQTFRVLPSLNDPATSFILDLRAHAGQQVVLGVTDAKGAQRNVPVTLRQPTETQGALGVNIAGSVVYTTSDPVSAFATGVQSTGKALSVILDGLGLLGHQIVTNPTQAPAGIEGPVGITKTLGDVVQGFGFVYLLILAAILSANLALVNVLPFPPLDGGRMAVQVVKRLAGKRGVSAVEGLSYLVGFGLLMAFIAWLSFHDITNLTKPGP